MAKKPHDPGKWAESEVQRWLQQRSDADASFAFHRYPDARAARGLLAAQPADFEASSSPFSYNVEVKETANPRRLPKQKISQFGMLKKFHLAGKSAYVVVFRSAHQDWYVFTGHDLFYTDDVVASFPFDPARPTFPTAAAAMESIFG